MLTRYISVYACNHTQSVILLVSPLVGLSVSLRVDALLVSLYCTCNDKLLSSMRDPS